MMTNSLMLEPLIYPDIPAYMTDFPAKQLFILQMKLLFISDAFKASVTFFHVFQYWWHMSREYFDLIIFIL